MKAVVVGAFSKDIVPVLEKYKIEIIQNGAPDVVISYGGDGSLLTAEREFAGLPKFPIRDTRASPLCKNHSHEALIKDFLDGQLQRTNMIKLSAILHGREVIALNDIFIHNYNRVSAIRYQIVIDGEIYSREAASDSFGVATPHGSAAYFRNITGVVFRVGIGMAFSNSRERENHLVLSDESEIRVKILRGPAMLVADNSPESISINSGDEIIIRKNKEVATVYGLKEFMCPDCRKLRHKV